MQRRTRTSEPDGDDDDGDDEAEEEEEEEEEGEEEGEEERKRKKRKKKRKRKTRRVGVFPFQERRLPLLPLSVCLTPAPASNPTLALTPTRSRLSSQPTPFGSWALDRQKRVVAVVLHGSWSGISW